MKKIAQKCKIFLLCLLLLISYGGGIANAFAAERVSIGGEIVGFRIPYDGVEVVGFSSIDDRGGGNARELLKKGDLIQKIDGKPIKSVNDISLYLTKVEEGKTVIVTVFRDGETVNLTVTPHVDAYGIRKFGISAKDSVAGLGTLTYVREDGRFGALGHAVSDGESNRLNQEGGKLYDCVVGDVVKGEKGKAGAISGYLSASQIGVIDKSNAYGLYGVTVIADSDTFEVASRNDVKMGKAQICSCVSGKKEFYDIEIIRASYQRTDGDKGLIIRVTDKRLLALTGGIVQGMSGSPIVQNGKIIGAVTHVFVNDPSRGYGIYLDWMFEN